MDYIRRSVHSLVQRYGTSDPYELAQALGIEIDEYPFTKIKGIAFEAQGEKLIVVNSTLSWAMKRLVVAHELGHHVLSLGDAGYFFLTTFTLMEPKVEYNANRFAVELVTYGKRPCLSETLEQFAGRTGVPLELIRYKVIK